MKTIFLKSGALMQGFILGVLLALAIFNLAIIANDVRLFRYQGF
jgi:hypothetical protein